MSDEAPRAWRMRTFRPDDESFLVGLFQEVFGRPITAGYWRWKLKGQPSPVENVGVAVGEEDRPIFQLGGIPCRFQIGSREATVMIAVDAMTAPAYRRQGILRTVGQALFRSWQEAGVAMAMGLPNEQYDKATLGWQALFPLRWRLLPLRPERILAGRLGLPWIRRWQPVAQAWRVLWGVTRGGAGDLGVREIRAAGPELDEVWDRCRDRIGVSPIRDRSWVAWRYLSAPHIRYRVLLAERAGRPVGFVAYGIRGGPDRRWGLIPELLTSPDDSAARSGLIREVVRRLMEEDVDGVAALAVPHTSLDRLLRRLGFLWSWGAFSVECATFAPWLRVEELRRRGDWHLTGGEFDVI